MSLETVIGALLLVAPVWFNVTFAILARTFDYPDILRRPTDEVLARFRAGGSRLRSASSSSRSIGSSASALGSI